MLWIEGRHWMQASLQEVGVAFEELLILFRILFCLEGFDSSNKIVQHHPLLYSWIGIWTYPDLLLEKSQDPANYCHAKPQ